MANLPFEKLLQPIWDVSIDAIHVTSNERLRDEQKIIYVNSAFETLSGYSRKEAMGAPATILNGTDTDLEQLEMINVALHHGLPGRSYLACYRKDGSQFLCRRAAAPLVSIDGIARHFIFFTHQTHLGSLEGALLPQLPVTDQQTIALNIPVPLTRFARGKIPEHLKSHPELDALLALWIEKCGSGSLPQRNAFDLHTVKRWAAYLSIATVTAEGRFQFSLFGTALASVHGSDLTNRFLDEVAPRDLWAIVLMHYREVVKTRKPLFAPVSVSNGQWYTEVSRLLLPLSTNGVTVDRVMAADYQRSFT
jgi:PAS domain S-box-containing protein